MFPAFDMNHIEDVFRLDHNRISIFGGPGAGKTTFAKSISANKNTPVFHTDYIRRGNGWFDKPKDQIKKQFDEILMKPRWIIEGNCSVCFNERVYLSDLIVILHFPTYRLLKNVTKRLIANYGKTIPECPQCKEHFNIEFFQHVISFNKTRMPQIISTIQNVQGKQMLYITDWKSFTKLLRKGF